MGAWFENFAPNSLGDDDGDAVLQQDLFGLQTLLPNPTFPKSPFDQALAAALIKERHLCRLHGQTLIGSADLQGHIRNLKRDHNWVIKHYDYFQMATFPNGEPRKRRQRYFYLSDAERARILEAIPNWEKRMVALAKPRFGFGARPTEKMLEKMAAQEAKAAREMEEAQKKRKAHH